jgi:sporulation protein YlmC with PRC-barrel domain
MEVSPMRRLSAVLLVAVAVAGCKKSEPPAAAATPQAAPAGAEAAAPQGTTIKGKVLERLDAPPYSYLKLSVGKEEMWAAVPKADTEKGKEVTVVNAMPMNGFESKTLNRKFDVVFFGTLEGAAPAADAKPVPSMDSSPANMAAQHANVGKGPVEVGDVKVDKATGADARTVAEVYAQKGQLKDKPVTIRGKVVKYNAGIMGKNWLHLRDGSGAADKDNDLTITSQDVAKVGDVVVIKGAVRVDKDFGAGYAYPVIVEDAKISK